MLSTSEKAKDLSNVSSYRYPDLHKNEIEQHMRRDKNWMCER